jgi:methyl-accepting chemotaxis protein
MLLWMPIDAWSSLSLHLMSDGRLSRIVEHPSGVAMKRFSEWTIGSQMLAGFVALALTTVAVGYIGITSSSSINRMLEAMYDDNLVPIGDIGVANMEQGYQNKALYAYVLEPGQAGMDRRQVEMDAHEALMKKSIDKYRATLLNDEEKRTLARFDETWLVYMKLVHKVTALANEGKQAEAAALMNSEVAVAFKVPDD